MSMETDKIILRPWRESDAEALFKYASDPNVGPRAGWPPHKSVEESLEIIRTVFHNDHTWAIELKQTGESIGCIGYYLYGESNITIGEHDAEVGYWVAKPYWNQGICSESLRLMIDYCFQEQHFEVLWCDCFVDNPASERVMHKCGFRDTGAFNLCSHLYLGDDRLVKIMRLDGSAYIETKLFALNIPDETRKRPVRSLLCCSTRTLACAKAHVTTGKALVKHFRLALRSPHRLKSAGTPK